LLTQIKARSAEQLSGGEIIRMKFRVTNAPTVIGLAALIGGIAGCSAMPSRGWGNPGPGAPPLVQRDCAIVTISSPTRYACNGKVYTSFDLEKQRLAWETAEGTELNVPKVPTKY
jgi:hypothetical protein